MSAEDDPFDMPDQSAAVIFLPDGQCVLAIPKGSDDLPGGGKVPPQTIMATELFMRLQEGDISPVELVEAFGRRQRQ
jgi:hypothetical protein